MVIPMMPFLVARITMARLLGPLLIIAIASLSWLASPARAVASPPGRSAAKNETVFALLQVDIKDGGEAFERAHLLLIKSRPTLKLALTRPGIARLDVLQQAPDPVGWLEMNLRVDLSEDGRTLRIAVRGTAGDELAAIVNAVTDAYVDFVRVSSERKLKDLREELLAAERQFLQARDALRKADRGGDHDALARAYEKLEYEARTLTVLRARLRQESELEVRLVQRAQASKPE
jgi:hypothetical protein